MRNFQRVFHILAGVRYLARGKTAKKIKRTIGDSVKNNRTVTVSQAVRYLNRIKQKNLAAVLQKTSDILETEILKTRKNRTDAIDLSELVNTYRVVVMNKRNSKYRQKIGNSVSKVG